MARGHQWWPVQPVPTPRHDAIGGGSVDYRQENLNSNVDPLLAFDPVAGTCVLGSQCVSATRGGYNVKEVFAETFIPILSELPLIKSLNATIGDRYSRYDNGYGSTNNFKFAVEYKPIDDLLLRGTLANVFRAPNLAEAFNGAAADAPKLSNDPCNGYTGAPVNPACVNVPTNGTFINQAVAANNQITGILSGAQFAGIQLKPERGKSFDFGAVYSPSWAPGLSATVDFWHVYLNNTITTVNAQERPRRLRRWRCWRILLADSSQSGRQDPTRARS